jgi:hypothetical protein
MKQPKRKLPLKVRVGYQDIDVIVCSDQRDGRLQDTEGFYLSSQAKILINDRQCASEQFATLIHEMLHAVFYTYGMREIIEDKTQEEYIVNTVSGAIIQIFRDNPFLLNGIVK